MIPAIDSSSLSHGPKLDAGPIERYVPKSLADLKAMAQGSVDWLWHGYLASRSITLLTSLWKAGKSTLISVLLSRMKTAGTVAGLPVRAGRAVVISEEPPEKWVERGQLLDLDRHVDWFCLPFTGTPTEEDWLALVDRVLRLHDERPFSLLVIDSLANLLPMRTENDSVQMLRPLKPLRRLTERGISVLISHHPKKGPTLPGQAARGSGALLAFVDIIVEMQPLSHHPHDRRRHLRSFSRHSATPPRLIIEWTADGTNYRSMGTSTELDYEHGWPHLRSLLEQADRPLTRRDILRSWPDTAVAPSKLTLWKWLGRAVEEDRLVQNGLGTRKDPYYYHLPGMVEKWQQDLRASLTKRLQRHQAPKSLEPLETPLSPNGAALPSLPALPLQEAPPRPEPEPREETTPETPSSPSPVPPLHEPEASTTKTNEPPPPPSQTPDVPEPAPSAPSVRLEFPWNIMNPADVPEHVWQQARAAQQSNSTISTQKTAGNHFF